VRVALDARKLRDFGIGTYIGELLAAFAELGCPEELVVYLPPGPPDAVRLPDAAGIERRIERARPYSAAELWRLAWAVRRDRAQLFHAPHYVCPPWLSCPAVVTIHDLIHLRFPEHRRHPLAPLYARVMLRLAVRRAAALITVSHATREELEVRLGAPRDRIHVIPNGVAPRFRPAGDDAALAGRLEALGVRRPYWLFVGNPLPHKNLGGLLDAFAGLDREPGELVLAGIPPAARGAVERALAARELQRRVRVLAPLPVDSLPSLYQGATGLVCPWLWEGFGLPALEAMACGTPVIAAARGALPEVLSGAGVLVDPTNVDALREAMYNLASNEILRAALGAAGVSRASEFSWRAAAEATVAVYREVLERRPGNREPV
jgi:alpha-1,3-rhamnosyl/mannosyltransferase